MLRFFIAILTLTLSFFAALYFGQSRGWIPTLPTFSYEILLFLAASTLFIFYVLIKRLDAASFIQSYLISIVLKLLVGGGFIFVLIYLDGNGAVANTALFILAYILFTALEVGFLFSKKNG